MPTYTPYTVSEYAPDAPGTADHFRRWFENWEAGFAGVSGAPRLVDAALDTTVAAEGISWVGARVAAMAVGAVGSYAFLGASVAISTTFATAGTTKAGSALKYAGMSGTVLSTVSPSGTWECLGHMQNNSPSQSANLATMWVRIA